MHEDLQFKKKGIKEMIIKKETMKLYRIQSIKRESLWYSFDGKFEDKLKEITGEEIPMPWEEFRQIDNKLKLLSSVKDLKMLPKWFSEDHISRLFNSGYYMFDYIINDFIVFTLGVILF